MASFKQYTAGGGASENFSIKTFATEEINVRVDGVLKTAATHYNITNYTANGGTVTWTSGNIPNGVTVRIYRITDTDPAQATFSTGSSLKAADLNDNQTQLLRGIEESHNQSDILVQNWDLEDDLITTSKVKNEAITNAKIENSTITATKIANDTITATQLANNAITTDKIINDAVTADKLENIAQNRITGRVSSGSGNPEYLTAAQVRTMINVEDGATADQSNTEIRAAVEAASDSNVFTDADHSKLNAIEAGATADQSNAEIRAAVEAASDSNVFTDADHTKLNGIETAATADQTSTEIKALLASDKITSAHIADEGITGAKIENATITAAEIADDTILANNIAENQISELHINAGGTAGADKVLVYDSSEATNWKWADQSGSGGTTLTIKEEGSALATAASSLNFVGGSVTASGTGADKTITITDANTTYTTSFVDSSNDCILRLTDSASGTDDLKFVAGSNITLTPSGDNLTIAASGGEVTVQDEGSALSTAATTLNFVGAGVTATGSGATKTITITSSSSTTDFQYLELKAHNNTSGAFATGSADYELVTKGTTTAVDPLQAAALIISIGGVIQQPNTGTSIGSNDGFCVDGSSIHFGANLTAHPDYIIWLKGAGTLVSSDQIVDGTSKLEVHAGNAGSSDGYAELALHDATHSAAKPSIKFERGKTTFNDGQNEADYELALWANGGGSAKITWDDDDASNNKGTLTYSGTATSPQFHFSDDNNNLDVYIGTFGVRIDGDSDKGANTSAGNYGLHLGNWDFELYHDGTDSYIDNDTGNLYIRNNVAADVGGDIYLKPHDNEDGIKIVHDGGVELYYDNAKKAETVTGGFTVTGTCTATAFAGDGSGLTNVSSGTITALNNQAANRLTTIGSTTTQLDGEANLTFEDTVSTGLISGKQITGRGFECPATVSDDWTIAAGNNAMFPGPMTVASGKTVTVPSGRTLTIV